MLFPVVAAGSPPPLTLAKFVTDGAAVDATLTTSVIGLALVPAARVAFVEHVTVGAANPQLQPVPAAETKPRPAGNVSVTVIAPLVEAEPGWFVTVSV